MRKTWALVMAAAMAAASLTACSSSKPAETAAPETDVYKRQMCGFHGDFIVMPGDKLTPLTNYSGKTETEPEGEGCCCGCLLYTSSEMMIQS